MRAAPVKFPNQHLAPASSIGLQEKAAGSPAEQAELRQGGLCPICQVGRLDYDGLLNLACPNCGALSGGCFT